MNYIVFDLEWNQCPNGKNHENRAIPFEIIEIGAVKLNSEKEEIGRFHEIIKPVVYQAFHFKTQEILKMNMEDFKNARLFPDVIKSFLDWCGKDAAFCIWGCSDLSELQKNMQFHKVAFTFPYPLKYYDIQKIFSIVYEDGKSRRNLEYAIDLLNIEKSMVFHQALSDAFYTARVMKYLTCDQILGHYSIDYFHHPINRKEEIYATFDTYSKFVSKPFKSKTEAMKDRTVASTKCYLCNKAAHKKIRWFSSSTKNYYCLAFCEEHGYLKGKIRMKKSENDKFYCVKTLKLVKEEDALIIKNRQELLRNKKRLKRYSH